MPSVAAKVRNLVHSFGEIAFSTAQVLSCGKRNAVDIELSRLVKQRVLKRLASGVFVLNIVSGELPSAREIARVKAKRFGKELVLGTSSTKGDNCFHTNGCRTTFRSIHGQIRFKHLASSKRRKASFNPAHAETGDTASKLVDGERANSHADLSLAATKLAARLMDLILKLINTAGLTTHNSNGAFG